MFIWTNNVLPAVIKAIAWLILLHRWCLFEIKVDGVFDVRRVTPNSCEGIQWSSASNLEVSPVD
ncbi:hypothetical protein CVE34_17720 [Pseudomonas syringae pv. actinidiae]|uniref:Uncharacterized protein n=2 Tax=Pseudomonas syringae group TaxID=136849 RepID=A0A2G9L4U6_PSESF|nr:hypothetical protein JN853_15295 [Pseudomonas syringae pv. actinidiae ICMP 9853]AQX59881.1 hypothetical protein B1R35_18495 [Pseudomonas syringae pv. actinidiae]AYL81788.1 hypothetical protein CN228_19400 [Pseudomonas syringae pv. actinidiae str. Shaanxi_M228]OZI83895.1 hypothetical protein CFN58_28500 [Pseudomonas avellanae]AQX65594.1 hypothetical protein B1F85_17425 [Pseudomonas syringae pv. actinidiae]